jgi:dTDP-4-amino-4,6-dideoxygalactose transaminase
MTKVERTVATLDLFRPFMAPDVLDWIKPTVTADDMGRIYCGQGPEVTQFEKEFGAFVGCRPPLSVNSCTSAITLALKLCGVGPGTITVATPMTCSATTLPVLNLGGHILWADVDEHGLIDPDSARKLCMAHKGHVKAVLAVDWGGRLADYDMLKYCGVPIIQDAAHHVMEPRGDYCCWSTQAIKHLTTGDGGFLLTPPEQHERAKLLRWYGFDREGSQDFRCAQDISEAGFKFHMNDIAASIGRATLQLLEGILQAHRNNAAMLSRLIYNPRVKLPPTDNLSTDWWLYTVRVNNRASLMAHLKDKGIACSQVHRRNDELSCFAKSKTHLPNLDKFSSEMVCIPTGWYLSPNDVQRVADAVNAWNP